MRGLAVWSTMALSFAICVPTAFARKSKTIAVQLYGDLFEVDEKGSVWRRAYLILPDGSRAEGLCLDTISNPCHIEPSAAEKRVEVPCALLKGDTKKEVKCYQSENYEAERKGNDITLHTAGGKVTYHLVGPW